MINRGRIARRRLPRRLWQPLCVLLLLLPLSPCSSCSRYQVHWPDGEVRTDQAGAGETRRVYTLGGGDRPNYEQILEDGRVRALVFHDGTGAAEQVDLRGEHPDWPHFLIILDGVPFDLIQTMYEEGLFRLFAPPVRVVSGFPAMTDVALSKVFHSKSCKGFEAQFYDRAKRALSSGNDVYLSGENAPWQPFVTYCAPQNVAVNTYLSPWSVFSTELGEMDKLFSRTTLPFASAYSVGAAGVGTREGEPGIRAYLTQVNQLCERITYDRRGRVRFSITADHGQGLQQCERVTFDQTLADAGFRVSSSLGKPRDVVVVSYGLVTCAQFYTDQPRAVAEALAGDPAVDLATFREGDHVYVLKPGAVATIKRRESGFVYDTTNGDPLELLPIIAPLRAAGPSPADATTTGEPAAAGAPISQSAVSADGTIADRPLLAATAQHRYPDPLHRIWTCFDGAVLCPPDVVVSLKADKCHGSKFFHFFVNPVASTHGSLESLSSVTFLLTNTTSSPLPAVLRSEDILDTIGVHLPPP